MKASALGALVGTLAPRGPAPKPDPFADLPPHLHDEMRSILGPIQDAGLPMEIDPLIPMSVGVAVEGILFRVVVVSDKGGTPLRVEILGPPNLTPWPKQDLLNLLPDAPAPAPKPLQLSPMPPIKDRRHQSDILENILEELRAIRACLSPP